VGFQFVGEVEVLHDAAPLPPRTRRVFGTPRSRSMCFVGREDELARLEAALASAEPARIAVEGLAGIAKTERALQLVHQLATAARGSP
jgi:hypothetical protein